MSLASELDFTSICLFSSQSDLLSYITCWRLWYTVNIRLVGRGVMGKMVLVGRGGEGRVVKRKMVLGNFQMGISQGRLQQPIPKG